MRTFIMLALLVSSLQAQVSLAYQVQAPKECFSSYKEMSHNTVLKKKGESACFVAETGESLRIVFHTFSGDRLTFGYCPMGGKKCTKKTIKVGKRYYLIRVIILGAFPIGLYAQAIDGELILSVD
jgi:hypothetical protein